MKKLLVSLTLIAALMLTGCGSDKKTAASVVEGHWAKVTKVSDGDTIVLDEKEKVRFIGVNTPETVKPNTPVQPYGKEASDFTKSQLLNKNVFVEMDVQAKDRYDRTLAYIYLQEPTSQQEVEEYMFNAILLREGYAQIMTISPNVKYSDMFVKIQRKAHDEKKGLWKLGIYKDQVKSTNDIFLEGKEPKAKAK